MKAELAFALTGMHAWADGGGGVSIPSLRVQLISASPDLPGFGDSTIWRALPGGTFLRMIDLAIGEHLGIGICNQCRGMHLSGAEYTEAWSRHGVQRCEPCNGSGTIDRITDYAGYMGLSMVQWASIERYFKRVVDHIGKGPHEIPA